MTLEELTGFFTALAPRLSGLGAIVKFDFGADGVLHVDATRNPAVISNEDGEAETTFTVSLQDFSDILAKKLPGDLAFSMGRLRVGGDKITGLRITDFLSR